MANTKSAKKRVKVSERNRVRNRAASTRLRTAVKKYRALLAATEKKPTAADLSAVHAAIDRGASKGVIRAATARRYKSRLALAHGRATAASSPS